MAPVYESAAQKARPVKHLRPEAPRHQPVTRMGLLGFESLSLRQPAPFICNPLILKDRSVDFGSTCHIHVPHSTVVDPIAAKQREAEAPCRYPCCTRVGGVPFFQRLFGSQRLSPAPRQHPTLPGC